MDIKINKHTDNYINFNIKGKDVNFSLVNAIRRVLLQEIPLYKIDNIKIDKNTTCYPNDYLSERLEQYDDVLKSKENYIDENNEYKYEKQDIYINIKNDSSDIMNVTSDNIDVYIDDKQIKNPYKEKVLLVKLKKDQELILKGEYILGKGMYHGKYTGIKVDLYEEVNENSYNFAYKSLCMLSTKELLSKAINIIIKKLENIEILVGQKYNNSTLNNLEKIEIILEDETHTMGNLITSKLQQKVQAGYMMNDFVEQVDERNVKIKIDSKNPMKILFDSIKELKVIFNNIKNKIK